MTPPSDAERARAWWDRLPVLDRWDLVDDLTWGRAVDWSDLTGVAKANALTWAARRSTTEVNSSNAPSAAFIAEVTRLAVAWAVAFDENDGWAP